MNRTTKIHPSALARAKVRAAKPKQYAEFPEVGVSAVGVDFEELRSCLHSDIQMTWKRVFREPVNELTPKDNAIRQRFLELAEEISNG
jgi:hypothetical protein